MRKAEIAYISFVVALALAFTATLAWSELFALQATEIAGWAVLVALGILAEALAIDFSVGTDREVKSAVTFLPLFACAILFPPAATVVGAVVIVCFAEIVLRHRVLWRLIVNTAQYALSYGLAGVVYTTVSNSSEATSQQVDFLAFTLLTVVFFATNITIVSGFYAVKQQKPLLTIIRQAIGPRGGNLWYDLLASPIAIIAAILYINLYVGGLLLILLPLLLIRYSYLSKLQLEEANRDLLRVLVKAIETRDPYTSGHSVRVAQLARAIAEDLRVPRRRIDKIETAALLHDIGKIEASYAKLIAKSSSLDDEERSRIRTHATKGADLLRSLTSLGSEVINGVRHHHERYDGRGYPDGLRGKNIPLTARIIAVCDAVDAMLSDRPYRSALSIDETRKELLRCAGSQFDPDIVNVIVEEDTLSRAAQFIEQTEAVSEAKPALQGT